MTEQRTTMGEIVHDHIEPRVNCVSCQHNADQQRTTHDGEHVHTWGFGWMRGDLKQKCLACGEDYWEWSQGEIRRLEAERIQYPFNVAVSARAERDQALAEIARLTATLNAQREVLELARAYAKASREDEASLTARHAFWYALARLDATPTESPRVSGTDLVDLAELAWGVIANAGWESQGDDWVGAATRWRDKYHAWLKESRRPDDRDSDATPAESQPGREPT